MADLLGDQKSETLIELVLLDACATANSRRGPPSFATADDSRAPFLTSPETTENPPPLWSETLTRLPSISPNQSRPSPSQSLRHLRQLPRTAFCRHELPPAGLGGADSGLAVPTGPILPGRFNRGDDKLRLVLVY
ncbi:hypothetical protein Droror1_Dr00014815 [Drosera rotundifolia]